MLKMHFLCQTYAYCNKRLHNAKQKKLSLPNVELNLIVSTDPSRLDMSNLKLKSEANFEAGELLTGKNNYAPSIHCYYYSCLQLAKSTLRHKRFDSYDSLNRDYKAEQRKRADEEKRKRAEQKERLGRNYQAGKEEGGFLGTHEYLIIATTNLIKNFNKSESELFGRRIGDLKTFRVKSDYSDIAISYPDCVKARDLAIRVRESLNNLKK